MEKDEWSWQVPGTSPLSAPGSSVVASHSSWPRRGCRSACSSGEGSARSRPPPPQGMLSGQHGVTNFGARYQLHVEARELHGRLADDLRERTGIDVGFCRWGLLELLFTAAELRAADRCHAAQTQAGLRVERLSREETLALEPALTPDLQGSISYGTKPTSITGGSPLPWPKPRVEAAPSCAAVPCPGPHPGAGARRWRADAHGDGVRRGCHRRQRGVVERPHPTARPDAAGQTDAWPDVGGAHGAARVGQSSTAATCIWCRDRTGKP